MDGQKGRLNCEFEIVKNVQVPDRSDELVERSSVEIAAGETSFRMASGRRNRRFSNLTALLPMLSESKTNAAPGNVYALGDAH